jgi:hypothetical protein
VEKSAGKEGKNQDQTLQKILASRGVLCRITLTMAPPLHVDGHDKQKKTRRGLSQMVTLALKYRFGLARS